MLDVKNISYQYSKGNPVLEDVNLSLEPGKLYGLLGKNGTGKTTLLKCMLGHLFPGSGQINIDENSVILRKPISLQQLYYIPEQVKAPEIKIGTYAKIHAPFYPEYSEELFNDLLMEFDLQSDMKLNRISHGMLKKAMLAFGLAARTRWLLLDEPTNGLDIPSKSIFRKVISNNLSEERGIIIATHQVKDIENLIDHLIFLKDGKIALDGSLQDIGDTLQFVKASSENELKEVIYSENTGFQTSAIVSRKGPEGGNVDLELLFNAVTFKEEAVRNAVEGRNHE